MCLDLIESSDSNLLDYSLSNPDTLTKYKTAGTIAQKALETVTGNIGFAYGIKRIHG